MKWWHAIRCKLGHHKSLNVIQTFGAQKHIGCPRCGRQMGMHGGLRIVIPWDDELDQLYQDMGYDTVAATAAWEKWRKEHYK